MEIKERVMDIDSPPIKAPSNLPSNAKLPLKIDTVLWIILSVVTLFYSDLINVLQSGSFYKGMSFTIALASGGLSLAIALYLILWCSYIKGISTDDWEANSPLAIPIATGGAVLSGICWNICLWGVYGIKTPLIILILFMGFVMIVSILPSGSSVDQKQSVKPHRKAD